MASKLAVKVAIKAKDLLSRPTVKMSGKLRQKLGGALGKVRVKANKAGKSFKKLKKRMKALKAVAGSVAKKMGMMLGAMVAIAVFSFKKYVDKADSLAKFGKVVQMSVSDLQSFRYASEIAGVGVENFDSSLLGFTKRMGELKANTGSAYTLLSKVSPTLMKQLKSSKSTKESFLLLMDALNKIEDPQKRAALAAAMFGRSGVKMALMAKGGRKEFEKLNKESKSFGQITDKQSKSAEAAADALVRVKHALTGVTDSIMAKLTPVITPLLEKMAKWIAANRKLISAKVSTYIKKIVNALKKIKPKQITDALEKMKSAFEFLKSAALPTAIAAITTAMIALTAVMWANPIIAIFGALALAAVAIYVKWDWFKEKAAAIWDAIGGTVFYMVKRVKKYIAGMKKYFTDWYADLKNLFASDTFLGKILSFFSSNKKAEIKITGDKNMSSPDDRPLMSSSATGSPANQAFYSPNQSHPGGNLNGKLQIEIKTEKGTRANVKKQQSDGGLNMTTNTGLQSIGAY